MLILRPHRSAIGPEQSWTMIWAAKVMAPQSETWFASRTLSPVSGSVTVANCRMKPSLATILPPTDWEYPMYLEDLISV